MTVGLKGCFGHIITYSDASSVCEVCDQRKECRECVSNRSQQLRRVYGIETISELLPTLTSDSVEIEIKDIKLTVKEKPAIKSIMTKKAKEYSDSLVRSGIDLRMAALGKYNPIHSRPAFLRIAFQCLLDGGYTNRELSNRLQRELGWTEKSARSHVGIATSLFNGLEIIEKNGETFQLKPVVTTKIEVRA